MKLIINLQFVSALNKMTFIKAEIEIVKRFKMAWIYFELNASEKLFWRRTSSHVLHSRKTGTIENRFAIGISSYTISTTKAIWIPSHFHKFYSHERHTLIPISPVFISQGSNHGSHVVRYSISTPKLSWNTESWNPCR